MVPSLQIYAKDFYCVEFCKTWYTTRGKRRRKPWFDFPLWYYKLEMNPPDFCGDWSKYFEDKEFVNRYISNYEMPGADKLSAVGPCLKQDTIRIHLWPSKYYEETGSTLSARHQRRTVSIINALLYTCFDWIHCILLIVRSATIERTRNVSICCLIDSANKFFPFVTK